MGRAPRHRAVSYRLAVVLTLAAARPARSLAAVLGVRPAHRRPGDHPTASTSGAPPYLPAQL